MNRQAFAKSAFSIMMIHELDAGHQNSPKRKIWVIRQNLDPTVYQLGNNIYNTILIEKNLWYPS